LAVLADPQDPQTAIANRTVYAPAQTLSGSAFGVLLFQELQAMKAVAGARGDAAAEVAS
jgi:hypothetical protein